MSASAPVPAPPTERVIIVANDYPGPHHLPKVVVERDAYEHVLTEGNVTFEILRNVTVARFRAALAAHGERSCFVGQPWLLGYHPPSASPAEAKS